jgi:adenylate cyclase
MNEGVVVKRDDPGAPPPPLDPPAPAPPRIGPFLTDGLRAIRARLEEVKPRLQVADDEAVHDLRVGIRRARTILTVGAPVFGRHCAGQVRRALREVHRATGALRDEEVLLELLGSIDLGAHASALQGWLDVRRRRERALRTQVRRAIASGTLDRGLRLIDALLAFDVKPSRDKRLSKFARRSLDEARRQVDRLLAAATEDPSALHALRIGYKHQRYTAELFAEAPGYDANGGAAAVARTASRFQSLIGRIHDVEVAEAAVLRARGLPDGARAALLGELAKLRDRRAQAYDKACGLTEARPGPRNVEPSDARAAARTGDAATASAATAARP